MERRQIENVECARAIEKSKIVKKERKKAHTSHVYKRVYIQYVLF